MNHQKGSAAIVLLVVLVVILAGVLVYFGFFKKPGEVAVSPTSTTTKTPNWVVYVVYNNGRVNYSFEYPYRDLSYPPGFDETIKYPNPTLAENQDLVQFVVNGITYSIRTYVRVRDNSVESWIKDVDVSYTSGNLQSFTKTQVGGKMAYTLKTGLVTYVYNDKNVYVISAHTGQAPLAGDDTTYARILSTFKFTPTP